MGLNHAQGSQFFVERNYSFGRVVAPFCCVYCVALPFQASLYLNECTEVRNPQ